MLWTFYMSWCLMFLDQMHNYSPMERSIAVTDFLMSEPLPFYGSIAGFCSDGTQCVLSVKLYF